MAAQTSRTDLLPCIDTLMGLATMGYDAGHYMTFIFDIPKHLLHPQNPSISAASDLKPLLPVTSD